MAENAELAEQVNFAEENEKILEDFEEKLHLANQELEKCKSKINFKNLKKINNFLLIIF